MNQNGLTTIQEETLSNGTTKKNGLRSKVFVERNSPIEDLINNKHVVPLHKIFLAIIIGHISHTISQEYFYEGRINFGQRVIINEFSSLPTFVLLWIPIFLLHILVYYGFKYWATVRAELLLINTATIFWDYLWLGLTITYYTLWLCLVPLIILKFELSCLLLLVLHVELTRMVMKAHSFIRNNVPRVLNYKPHTEHSILYPSFSQFMYFFWAPTLIYRDSYPRTQSIRWSYVAKQALHFTIIVFFLSTILENNFVFTFKDFGIKSFGWGEITAIIFRNAGGAMLITISTHYIVLHVWLNAFSEICRFGDRRFYEDWWNSSDYDRYYRTWNIVVHDWLYIYVYKDFYEIIAPGRKLLAKYAVFFLSALFHDYILAFGFRFFLPILFIQFFVLGTAMTFVRTKSDTIATALLFYGLALGNSINMSFFSIEYYARVNCPIENPTLYSYFTPRFVSCGIAN